MIAILRALACGLLLPAVSIAAAGPNESVAIIYQVSGETLRSAPGRSPEPLRLFDCLPAGAILELKSGSRLALAFATGKRYELTGPARATLGKEDLAARSGGVRPLSSVPPLRLSPIAEGEHPGPTAGAIRIRGDEIQGLYPDRGARALASAVVLRFAGIEGAQRYWIEVEDGQGKVVYSAETASSELSLPADALRPGVSYHWSVRTIDRSGPVARGEGDFATLDAETARMREELRRFVERAGDGEITSLLAGVDRELGLLAEARAELRVP
jgi:hypothetical protein